jgi:mono/diheme cytochrome c family protein
MLVVAASIHGVSAQDKPAASVRDGIYTAEQAARGQTAYTSLCASCHGPALEGRGQTPPLAGAEFTSAWNGMTMWDLFDRIQVSMPADHPGQLTKDQNATILAYILKVNGFPAGAGELPTNENLLTKIRVDAPPAPR